MKEYLSIKIEERPEIIEKIMQALSKDKGVVFAFIFGSFLDAPSFRDIDIGVYLDKIRKEEVFEQELELSKKIADKCGLPFDIVEVKVLNFAPNSFLNNIFSRGQLLFARRQQFLSDLIEVSSLDAIANEHIAYQSLKELIPA